MKTRKNELRSIVLDIVFEREKVSFEPSQFGHLTAGVAEILERQAGDRTFSGSVFTPQVRLDPQDEMLVQEIFWDLIVERVLTIGNDSANPLFPWFRLHSDAEANLKSD